MADKDEIQKSYGYHAMSSKVIQSTGRRRGGEPTGEVEAIKEGRMGDRVVQSKREPAKQSDSKSNKKQKKDGDGVRIDMSIASILDQSFDRYLPTNESSRTAYEALLTVLGSSDLLGNQDPSIIQDAATEVIGILKDEELRDPERHDRLSKLLTGRSNKSKQGLPQNRFDAMIQIGKQISDYKQALAPVDEGREQNEDGVAVQFEEEDESGSESDEDADQDVVVALSSEDDESDAASTRSVGSEVSQSLELNKKKKKSFRTLSTQELDSHFLERHLSEHFENTDKITALASDTLQILAVEDLRVCENRLLDLLGIGLFDSMQLLLHNRLRVWACVSMKRATTDMERKEIEERLSRTEEGRALQHELQTGETNRSGLAKVKSMEATSGNESMSRDTPREDTEMMDESNTLTDLDLEGLAKQTPAVADKSILPEGTWRSTMKGYEEVHVPASQSIIPEGEVLIPISSLPRWSQAAFPGVERLNRVQSRMCNVALKTSENILLCAPTGAGKTNVACLTMMSLLAQHMRKGAAELELKELVDLSAFKIVYIAPMKALVQEVVMSFLKRLSPYGINVRELSGDSSLTRHQISETQVIVTTPEKWDIVTRQGEGRAFTQLVKLVIIDEIHLLHDDRGSVLESIVSRVIRQVEDTAEPVRLVGLSATLPNYTDVAAFLRVKPDKGLFFFDGTFRPIPLQMQYVGISERSAFKRFQLQNEICYEKVSTQRRGGHQVLVFVHSRAETGKTARALRDMALEKDELSLFVRDGSGTQEILREEASSCKNSDLKDVLPFGFATHHAGMVREDRELVEELFKARHIGVLFSTATLAWGVNLPARAVIIRGTQVYDPSKGHWTELSPLDILQMIGRAGRPGLDDQGEGIILTQHSQLQFYLSLTNLQVPVESKMVKALPNHLNAEVVLGAVQSIEEAVEWLGYSFLFVRMLRNPSFYGLKSDGEKDDPRLVRHRRNLIHSAAVLLEGSHLVRYDRRRGILQPTALGRIASRFYLSYQSMAIYTKHMRPNMSDIEIFRLFAMSGEFSHVTVREDEKLELAKLSARVPVPIKEAPTDKLAKINVLLQAYISRMKLDGFALAADMAFVQQSAARIMRALFEIALRKNWSSLARLCLELSSMVVNRVWRSQTPLRQFKNLPEAVARKLESKTDVDWGRYVHLTPADIGELVSVPKMGRILHTLVHQYPRVEVEAQSSPISRSLMKLDLSVAPSFLFDASVHGPTVLFHVIIDDVSGDFILHRETFVVRSSAADNEVVLSLFVPILDPLPPVYFVRVIADKWLHSCSTLPIRVDSMILPAKFPPPTEVLDLQPLNPKALLEPVLVQTCPYTAFNPIQTQTFHDLFKTDNNCLVCSPSGSGKGLCGLFAILRLLSTNTEGCCVYVAPTVDIRDATYKYWKSILNGFLPLSRMVLLTGDTANDIASMSNASIVLASVPQWDNVSRRWRQRKAIQNVSLFIFDELHFVGGAEGPQYEAVVARTRYICNHLRQADPKAHSRVVGLSAAVANAWDLGDWIGVSPKQLFNFSAKARSFPLDLKFQAFEEANYASRLMSMTKPTCSAVVKHLANESCLVFVPSKRQAQLTAIDIVTYATNQGVTMPSAPEKGDLTRIIDESLKKLAESGVGYMYSGMSESDMNMILHLFDSAVVRVLVCQFDLSTKIKCGPSLVVIMGTEVFDGSSSTHVSVPAAHLLHMVGRCGNSSGGGTCLVLCYHSRRDYLRRLLSEPLPIESHLDTHLHDPLNSEVVNQTVGSMQDAVDYMTWTFLYRRLAKNPTYYGLQSTSNTQLSEHLSEMVEAVVSDLEESRCCDVSDDGMVTPLNLGMIASYYLVQYKTIELMAASVTAKTRVRGVVEILSACWEFASLTIRSGEEKSLRRLARSLVYKLSEETAFDANTKALILLQCHFSRLSLPSELRIDQRQVLGSSVKLIYALVDVVSSLGYLRAVLAAMELAQMITQGLWNKDNHLLQIPHFDQGIVDRCKQYDGEDQIETVFDILSLDDDVRNSLLRLSDEKMADVAMFCNTYPSVEVKYDFGNASDIVAGDTVALQVVLEREIDEDDEDAVQSLGEVCAPLFPDRKAEAWWIVVGDLSQDSIYSLKRVSLKHRKTVTVQFTAPDEAGDYDLTLFCMCDSYLGCDQEFNISLSVSSAPSDDDDTGSEA